MVQSARFVDTPEGPAIAVTMQDQHESNEGGLGQVRVELRDAETGEPRWSVERPSEERWTDEYEYIVVGEAAGNIAVWTNADRLLIYSLEGELVATETLEDDLQYVRIGHSNDGTAIVWAESEQAYRLDMTTFEKTPIEPSPGSVVSGHSPAAHAQVAFEQATSERQNDLTGLTTTGPSVWLSVPYAVTHFDGGYVRATHEAVEVYDVPYPGGDGAVPLHVAAMPDGVASILDLEVRDGIVRGIVAAWNDGEVGGEEGTDLAVFELDIANDEFSWRLGTPFVLQR